ncbi:GntR family transcriptional regulator [Citrobacter farmeri]|uniref:GntR family transcriptional regulator n=1 Tax=Citrobacter farmeri TaxID=67824 RepID=UPI0018981600|nr:GntR family transcriptional regulator [Citrobacter farmeri]MDB2167759.1 GntR family transcriptional regulator [Citrobacter farmeri]HED3135964.1 GntR family transcriptional regulator [Citrobacter farmeri]HED3140560.1 GntR family transcriptional regulator [Citrobacter farmeri]
MDTARFIKDNFRFTEGSSASMYSQLAAFIRHQIKLGVFRPHDKIVTENALCDILNISRTTVRLAFNELLEEGLIVRQRRKGTFIADKKINRRLNSLYNFTESMREQGIKPRSLVLQSAVIDADEIVADKLNLTQTQRKVFILKRVRLGDDTPLLLETTCIPWNLCQGIERYDFSTLSLYDVLKNEFGLTITHATEHIEAVIISKSTAHYLQCAEKVMAGYHIERVSFLENGFVFEYTTSVTRADKCNFKIDLFNVGQNSAKARVDFSRQLKR